MKIEIFWSDMMFKCYESKICFNCSQKSVPRKKELGSNECCMGILSGSKKLYFWAFSRFLGPPKIPMHHSFDPNFFFWGHFLTAIKVYFTFITFKHHIRPKNVNFHISLKFIKQNRVKSLNKIERSSAISILELEVQKFA